MRLRRLIVAGVTVATLCLDLPLGGEGWRVLFRLTDPLNLSRLSRRTATVPFVP